MTESQEQILMTNVKEIHKVVIGTADEPEKSLVWKVFRNTSFRKTTTKVLWIMFFVILGLITKQVWTEIIR